MRKVLLLAALLSAAALAQPVTAQQFLYRIEPVRRDLTLQNMTEAERPLASQHAAYLKSLLDDGKLVLAGQAFNPNGLWGIVMVTAADIEAAKAIMNADPGVKGQLFKGMGEVLPFRTVFMKAAEASTK